MIGQPDSASRMFCHAPPGPRRVSRVRRLETVAGAPPDSSTVSRWSPEVTPASGSLLYKYCTVYRFVARVGCNVSILYPMIDV
jgi:hypothetical protein